MLVRSKILIASILNILNRWIIESGIDDSDKTGTSYVCLMERMVDLITTYVVTLIQRYRCSLENEFTESVRRKTSDGALQILTYGSLVGVVHVIF